MCALFLFFTVLEVVLGITLRFVYVPETLPLCFWAQRGRTRWGRSRCLDAPQAAEPRLREASGEQRSSQDKTRRQQSSGRRSSDEESQESEGRKPNRCREHPDDLENGFTQSCDIYTDWETVEEFSGTVTVSDGIFP